MKTCSTCHRATAALRGVTLACRGTLWRASTRSRQVAPCRRMEQPPHTYTYTQVTELSATSKNDKSIVVAWNAPKGNACVDTYNYVVFISAISALFATSFAGSV